MRGGFSSGGGTWTVCGWRRGPKTKDFCGFAWTFAEARRGQRMTGCELETLLGHCTYLPKVKKLPPRLFPCGLPVRAIRIGVAYVSCPQRWRRGTQALPCAHNTPATRSGGFDGQWRCSPPMWPALVRRSSFRTDQRKGRRNLARERTVKVPVGRRKRSSTRVCAIGALCWRRHRTSRTCYGSKITGMNTVPVMRREAQRDTRSMGRYVRDGYVECFEARSELRASA